MTRAASVSPDRGGRGRHHGRHTHRASLISRVMSAFFAVMLAVGIGLIAYPTVSDWWNGMHQSRAVAAYIEKTQDLSAAKRKQMLAAARAYNERLAASNQSARWNLTDEQNKEYESLLDVTGTGVMGYVTIPRIRVRLPIYHGTDDTVLQIAVGHLAGSSLPIGGASTHAAISGHTGLPSARLLTGLDKLEGGDTFAFHVLGTTYTYKIDQTKVVLPDELDDLAIEDGGDYATLITCTPYGVNSHRLLVRGHRIANPITPDTVDYDLDLRIMTICAIILAVLFVGCAVTLIIANVRRRWHKPKETIQADSSALAPVADRAFDSTFYSLTQIWQRIAGHTPSNTNQRNKHD